MLLECVLTAVNSKKKYIHFVPVFIDTWLALFPNLKVRVVLVNATIPKFLLKYKEHLIIFPPIPNVPTAFTSQFIRLLYPALLGCEGGVLITDIDMLPANRTYYTDAIQAAPVNSFVYMRNNLCGRRRMKGQFAIGYNVANSDTWGEINNIRTKEDVIQRLRQESTSCWYADQLYLKKSVLLWNQQTNRFFPLTDKDTKFKRLTRRKRQPLEWDAVALENHLYTDFHCPRPFCGKNKELVLSIVAKIIEC
jgi:hypothetical protein